MKRITITFAITALFLMLSNTTNAQAFEQGSINLDFGVGFGIYGTTQTATATVNGVVAATSKEDDGAVSTIIPIRFEYGIMDKVGIGVEFLYSNYVINDSDKVDLEKVSCVDFGVHFNYHLLNSDKNDLFITLGVGLSSMSINYTPQIDQIVESVTGSGVYYSFGLTDRIFFTDNIGILFNLGYRGYNYSSLESNYTPEGEAVLAAWGVSYSTNWEWKFSGIHLGTGLALKF